MASIGRVSHRSGGELDRSPHAVDLAVSELASQRHGLVTLAQVLERGMTPRMVEVRVRSGFLHPMYRGVFAVGHRPTSDEAWWLAA
ncbi:MAG: type IV toxin-antitoxin system AbiEi family antitoxin domain-containing protein, partial [Solirubrobacterales bacterium]